MRMSMRRFTRLTNAFSQKLENHAYGIATHFARGLRANGREIVGHDWLRMTSFGPLQE